uniref:Ribosomal protein S11 n=1 Tax=Strongyloides stercoralis TaxID=6248 RepID=A0A0K0E9U2_STRER
MSELSSLLSDNSSVPENMDNSISNSEQKVTSNDDKMDTFDKEQEEDKIMEVQEENEQGKSKFKVLLESIKDNPLKETRLSIAVEDLLVHYHGLLSSFGVSCSNHLLTSLDLPLKETAEIISKQVKDAALDVQSEFNKAYVQWKMMNPDEAEADELEDMKKAVERQNCLLNKCESKLSTKVRKNEGKHVNE